MLRSGDPAPAFCLRRLDGIEWRYAGSSHGKPVLLVFFEADCPTCQLTLPYLKRLAEALGKESDHVIGIAQDDAGSTSQLVNQMSIPFPIVLDSDLAVSRQYDPVAVPTLFLVNREGKIVHIQVGFDKAGLNAITAALGATLGTNLIPIAPPYDGAPDRKPGCGSRHRETPTAENFLPGSVQFHKVLSSRATRIELEDSVDPYEYCRDKFGDPLPVVPPTVERVEQMLQATLLSPDTVVGFIPPNYGAATVEKIAANAVMAGCSSEMMRVLIPTIRAACDERFNLHGIQATTHFAAPLLIVNGPIRNELGFACRSNVFSNVARANSTLGRALQLILVNLGGARAGEIDMSTLGNPGKFSYCIAENEEESPWEPLHIERGMHAAQNAVTLFGAEPPRGVSEHNARNGREVLDAITRTLATVWTYRLCAASEALVILCPEHVKTIWQQGFTKQDVREYLFQNTGIPLRAYDGCGEGTQYVNSYDQVLINGELCYRKFREPAAIKVIVTGGTAGKFSAVIGSWAAGPRGSEMVTYPIE